jgi:short-subunit dehydrogenase
MDIQGKTIVLTGASGGIGRAVAVALDKFGARLVLVGRSQARLDAVTDGLQGRHHRTVVADLTSNAGRANLRQVFAGDDSTEGPDVLVNCLGVNALKLFHEQSADDIENQVSTNLLSPMLVCHDLLPAMVRKPEALILNIGSTFGSIGYPGFSSYCASKFGLRGFTEALRRELADTPVRVSYVAPRATRTDLNSPEINAMNDALGTSTDDPIAVAGAIVDMIRGTPRASRFLGWPEKLFVRVNALLPQLVDKALRKQLPLIRRFAQSTSN